MGSRWGRTGRSSHPSQVETQSVCSRNTWGSWNWDSDEIREIKKRWINTFTSADCIQTHWRCWFHVSQSSRGCEICREEPTDTQYPPLVQPEPTQNRVRSQPESSPAAGSCRGSVREEADRGSKATLAVKCPAASGRKRSSSRGKRRKRRKRRRRMFFNPTAF